jgi:hypothetical protein
VGGLLIYRLLSSPDGMRNIMSFFYVFIVPGPFLRDLGEFGKLRLFLGKISRFFARWGGGQYVYLKEWMAMEFKFLWNKNKIFIDIKICM